MFDDMSTPQATRIRLKARRKCDGCGKVMHSQRKFCAVCQEGEDEKRRAGKRQCVECAEPVRGRSHRCAPCKAERRRDVWAAQRARISKARWNAYARAQKAKDVEKWRAMQRASYHRRKAKVSAQQREYNRNRRPGRHGRPPLERKS